MRGKSKYRKYEYKKHLSVYGGVSIEAIEQDYWNEIVYDSYVVTTVFYARKKPMIQLTIEELRLVIGQRHWSHFLIPFALEILNKNILAEGDLYLGDLLSNVLYQLDNFWIENTDWYNRLKPLIVMNKELLDLHDIDYDHFLTLESMMKPIKFSKSKARKERRKLKD